MNESENTFRKLTDDPLLVKSIWCYFRLHRWTQYGSPKQRREGSYDVDYQLRVCANCGLFQMKVLRKT